MVERHCVDVNANGTPRVYSQVAFPILTIDWRRIFPDPRCPRHQPLFGVFADLFDWGSFQRFGRTGDCSAPNLLFVFDDFFRIHTAHIWEMPHQPAMLTRFFWLSVHVTRLPAVPGSYGTIMA